MKELEVKILHVDKGKIEETLSRLGAKQVSDGQIETSFFDFKDSPLAKGSSVLRLRKEENKIVLTFKRVIGIHDVKIAEEHTVAVSNFQEAKAILESLSLSVSENMQKHRTSYELKNVHFDIDTYEEKYSYIPTLLEIEAKSTEVIHKYAKLLGFKAEDCMPWSVKDLIDYYSPKKSKTDTAQSRQKSSYS